MVGKSRMKGYTVATYLVPYSPQRPKLGMVKESFVNQMEIFWYPPNGDFKKYLLCLEKLDDENDSNNQSSFRNILSGL